jgi:hypothetical protein
MVRDVDMGSYLDAFGEPKEAGFHGRVVVRSTASELDKRLSCERCGGDVRTTAATPGEPIGWSCGACGRSGRVSGWEGTPWDSSPPAPLKLLAGGGRRRLTRGGAPSVEPPRLILHGGQRDSRDLYGTPLPPLPADDAAGAGPLTAREVREALLHPRPLSLLRQTAAILEALGGRPRTCAELDAFLAQALGNPVVRDPFRGLRKSPRRLLPAGPPAQWSSRGVVVVELDGRLGLDPSAPGIEPMRRQVRARAARVAGERLLHG